MTKWLVNRA